MTSLVLLEQQGYN